MSAKPKQKPAKKRQQSAYDGVAQRSYFIELGGRRRKVGSKEALQLKTYEDALKGKIASVRKVLKWINEREAARKGAIVRRLPVIKIENNDPVQMDDALLLLGIAVERAQPHAATGRYFEMQAWAAQEAIERLRKPLSRREVAELSKHIDESAVIRWPKGFADG